MTDPSAATITQAIVERLHTALHRTNGGPCDVVKVYGGELQKLLDGESVGGRCVVWVHPSDGAERPFTETICKCEINLAVFVLEATTYGEEARLLGKGRAKGAMPLVDDIRTLLFGQKLGLANVMPLQPDGGWRSIMETHVDELPAVLYEYDWKMGFESHYVSDNDGLETFEKIRAKYHTPADAADPVLEGVTELEE